MYSYAVNYVDMLIWTNSCYVNGMYLIQDVTRKKATRVWQEVPFVWWAKQLFVAAWTNEFHRAEYFLCGFQDKITKDDYSFVMCVCRSVCVLVTTTRLPRGGSFSWNFTFDCFPKYLSRKNQVCLESEKNDGFFTRGPVYSYFISVSYS